MFGGKVRITREWRVFVDKCDASWRESGSYVRAQNWVSSRLCEMVCEGLRPAVAEEVAYREAVELFGGPGVPCMLEPGPEPEGGV